MATNGKSYRSRPPQLETERLFLRGFEFSDTATVQRLLNDPQVSDNMLDMPYPYTQADAEYFIIWTQDVILRGGTLTYGLVPKVREVLLAGDTLVGCVYITPNFDHQRAEIGYWAGRDYRSMGYVTEATLRVIHYGFEEMGLQRAFAFCFVNNAGSARVLEKCGMTREGVWRKDVKKPDGWRDVVFYGLLRSEWEKR